MKQIYLSTDNYQVAFAQITQLLVNTQLIWRYQPFIEDTLAWQSLPKYRNLYQQVLDLTDKQLGQFDCHSHLVAWLGQFIPELAVSSCWEIKPASGAPIAVAKFADVGMPGRKKQQVEHFVGAFKPFYQTGEGIVDWCCGKGHLAGHFHQQLGCHTLGLEYDHTLVAKARDFACKFDLSLQYQCVDVLAPLPNHLFAGVDWHSGLHACGDLHVRLLRQAVALGHGVVIAPCCYHLIQSEDYRPLCDAAKAANLSLNKTDLRLAVLQMVTSGQRVRRLRDVELLWRTAFDLWLREVNQVDRYTPVKSLPKAWFSGCFVAFCRHMAGRFGLQLPCDFDGALWLDRAAQKLAMVKRLEFVRLGFRSVLELWLLLDRVLFLQQHGYEVELMRFCAAQLTPRNGMIVAWRNR